jgi:hypothetical protein
LVPPDKYQESTFIRVQPLPSKYFPMCNSSKLILFIAKQSEILKVTLKNTNKKYGCIEAADFLRGPHGI